MWLDVLTDRAASFARRILITGGTARELAQAFLKHPGTDVDVLQSPDGIPNELYDCIILDDPGACFSDLQAALAALGQCLLPDGYLFLHVPTPRGGVAFNGNGSANLCEEMSCLLRQAGLAIYLQWRVEDRCAPGRTADDVVRGDRAASPTGTGRAPEKGSHSGHLIGAIHPGYDPIAHARDLFRAGCVEGCYEVLALIPDVYLARPEAAAKVYADMQYCKAALAHKARPGEALARFFDAQVLFYRAVSRLPGFHGAYHTQAELWRRIGDGGMGLRLLRSVQHVHPDEVTRRAIEAWPAAAPAPSEEIEPPPWNAGAFRPRILMLMTPGQPHFGMDVLYDGLCTVLGDDHVAEFPWKKTLHGHAADGQLNYPCVFNRPGHPIYLDALLTQLREGLFDCVLFSDLEKEAGSDLARRVMDAAAALPLFIVDVQDDPVDNRPDVLDYLGQPLVHAYFKREMLACHDYGAHTYPLPFAYPDERTPSDVSGPRPRSIFWAGHRRFGLRRLYLERVEALLGTSFDKEYSPEEYAAALRGVRIGINLFGFGYDTVRYWELPAYGCMLLSERLPIRIPCNFRDGESAVFFDDVRDLEEKLAYWLARPGEAEVIAAAGHAHFRLHHTGSARARQLLGWMQSEWRTWADGGLHKSRIGA